MPMISDTAGISSGNGGEDVNEEIRGYAASEVSSQKLFYGPWRWSPLMKESTSPRGIRPPARRRCLQHRVKYAGPINSDAGNPRHGSAFSNCCW
jgi:hypothetical protein